MNRLVADKSVDSIVIIGVGEGKITYRAIFIVFSLYKREGSFGECQINGCCRVQV